MKNDIVDRIVVVILPIHSTIFSIILLVFRKSITILSLFLVSSFVYDKRNDVFTFYED